VRYLPNLITLIRLGLIWPVAAGLAQGNFSLALACFTAAGLSDRLDGFLARRYGWTSEAGKVLDPAADKLLLMTVFIECAWLGLTPWWLAAAAVARDLTIGAGAILFRTFVGPLHGAPTAISKINTLAQLGYMVGVMTHEICGFPPRPLLGMAEFVVLVTLVLSGAGYVITFARRAFSSPARHPS
jgi:cardiolipin synthase (CMP-forming)